MEKRIRKTLSKTIKEDWMRVRTPGFIPAPYQIINLLQNYDIVASLFHMLYKHTQNPIHLNDAIYWKKQVIELLLWERVERG